LAYNAICKGSTRSLGSSGQSLEGGRKKARQGTGENRESLGGETGRTFRLRTKELLLWNGEEEGGPARKTAGGGKLDCRRE